MTIRIRNRWHYRGTSENYDWWDWEAFLDNDISKQSNVDYVEYVLHPTFPNPVRKITDSKDGFVIKVTGYGSFMLKVFVHTKDGKMEKYTHVLKLEQEPTEGISE
jgi:transcription initiation factor IIF auxiliary subunit